MNVVIGMALFVLGVILGAVLMVLCQLQRDDQIVLERREWNEMEDDGK